MLLSSKKRPALLIAFFLLPALACNALTLIPGPEANPAGPIEVAAAESVEPAGEPAAGTPEPTLAPAPTGTAKPPGPAAPGELVEYAGYSFAVITLEDPTRPSESYRYTEGMRLVGVEIIVGNVSGEVVTINPLNATLVDAEGVAYPTELAAREGQLILIDLGPGERVRGWVAFKIPDGSVPESIQYQITAVPGIVLQSRLEAVNGQFAADAIPPLTASGDGRPGVTASLGEVVEVEGYSLVAEAVEDPARAVELYWPRYGQRLVAVQIAVGNVSGPAIIVTPLNARLVDGDGFIYVIALGAGRNEQLEQVELSPGQSVSGWVAFEIPEDATLASLKYIVSSRPLVVLRSGLAD
ncbi:MAG: DUF4352 domain-containing protein [Chloroflexi bacterium]|nr:DUF4352 domain-containing protein [Chloroflexota bacterium]